MDSCACKYVLIVCMCKINVHTHTNFSQLCSAEQHGPNFLSIPSAGPLFSHISEGQMTIPDDKNKLPPFNLNLYHDLCAIALRTEATKEGNLASPRVLFSDLWSSLPGPSAPFFVFVCSKDGR